MRTGTLAFLIGIVLLQQFNHLPSQYWIGSILAAAIFSRFMLKKYWHYLRLPILCAIGFAWCLWYAQSSWSLPSALEGKTITITGYIATIPIVTQRGTAFKFAIKSLQFDNKQQTANGLIRLTWRNDNANLHVGDKWQLAVRLKKTYGTLNPGGFDYEALAFQEGIRANGYIVNQLNNTRLNHRWYRYTIDRIRQHIKTKIAANLPVTTTSPWITALTIGERHDIDTSEWQILRNTGTNHLMAIAGLHIGLMAALAHFLVSWLWCRIPRFALKIPANHAGAIAALLMALTYSAMAGFSIPTQRACIMLLVFLSTLLLRRYLSAWHAWSAALLCMLLWNPLCVLTESFWLSFGSVALIIYGVSGRILPSGLWWKWGRIQWVIAVGLIPLSVWLFQQCSLVSFLANSVAIPWVGFIVVPLSLLGCVVLLFSPQAGGLILQLADKILSVLWKILAWFSQLPGVVWYQHVPATWMLIVAIVGVVLLLCPIGLRGRYVGLIGLLPLVLYQPNVPQAGDARLTLLDVGQGLSAVVQTEKHVLVFDAGPRVSATFDMGDSVVVPFLHQIGAHQVDMMVISHGDNDHIGGAYAVAAQFPVHVIKTSVPQKFLHADYCLRGDAWDWDGVHFAFLYPVPTTLGLDNNSSCVLQVTSHGKHILLTGDIEKLAEREMVSSIPDVLHSDILVAPHHGSKTSGVKHFVALVSPQFVLYPVGYRNRYHFPHVSVVKSYQALGAQQYQAAFTGAMQFQLTQGKIESPQLYRVQHRHYWNN